MRGSPRRCLVLLALVAWVQAAAADCDCPEQEWHVLWEDDFDSFQSSKWEVQLGNGCAYSPPDTYDMCGWGNGELQNYTANPDNLRAEDGNLIIEARKGTNGSLTSARIRTLGRYAIAPSSTYKTVKVEASIRLPKGNGLWPAFWMLPWEDPLADELGAGDYGGWPSSGEIDIMEAWNDMTVAHASLHYGGPPPKNRVNMTGTPSNNGQPLYESFHTYAIEWEASRMRWFLDGYQYFEMESGYGNSKSGGWYSTGEGAGPDSPFDRPFYIIINLALGGSMTGYVSAKQVQDTLELPKQLLVDYVRVYGRTWT